MLTALADVQVCSAACKSQAEQQDLEAEPMKMSREAVGLTVLPA